jgi:hypothetical protein
MTASATVKAAAAMPATTMTTATMATATVTATTAAVAPSSASTGKNWRGRQRQQCGHEHGHDAKCARLHVKYPSLIGGSQIAGSPCFKSPHEFYAQVRDFKPATGLQLRYLRD